MRVRGAAAGGALGASGTQRRTGVERASGLSGAGADSATEGRWEGLTRAEGCRCSDEKCRGPQVRPAQPKRSAAKGEETPRAAATAGVGVRR